MSAIEIAPSITQHTVVYCIEKQDRAIAIQSMLTQSGFKVTIAVSFYDALKVIAQEMPHFIICEAVLSDGNAGQLYDKLQLDPVLKNIPIMLQIIRKSKDELAMITNRKFAGYYMGQIEQKAFLDKVQELLKKHSLVSPFFCDLESCGKKTDIMLNMEAQVLGRSTEQLIAKSPTELDPVVKVVCVPKSNQYPPALLLHPTNLKSGEEYFNMFPLDRIVGKGKLWINKLKLFEMTNLIPLDNKTPISNVQRRVLYCDNSQERYEGFRDILSGHDVELIYTATLADVLATLKKEPDAVGAIFVHDMPEDAASAEFKAVYGRIPVAIRPPLIIATPASGAKSSDTTRYIKRPFGLGVFVQAITSSFLRGNNIAAAVQPVPGQPNPNSVQVTFQTPARVLGLDESGGVIQLNSPIARGAKISLANHEFLSTLFSGQTTVQVTTCVPAPNKKDTWQIRFNALGLGLSKVKYWEKISKVLTQETEKYTQILEQQRVVEEALKTANQVDTPEVVDPQLDEQAA